jgi:hypothetical protein
MNLADLSGFLGAIIGFLLTLMVFSYWLSDNFMFRLAIHIFIGVATGYMLVIALYTVIWPRLVAPLLYGAPEQALLALVPLVASILLLGKATNRLASLGRPVMAFLVGVGAAVAVGGAVLGTLIPQVNATINLFNLQAIWNENRSVGFALLNGLIILIGSLATLAYFQFSARSSSGTGQRPVWLQSIAAVGQVFIAVALGAVFAGVYAAALTALIERIGSLINAIFQFITPAA